MTYLSEMIGNPVIDANGEKIGVVNDLGIATREVFPRVTSLAFQGPGKTPFMISWRKYVASFDDDEVRLAVPATDIRFSYLQPNEVLIARDLLNKQIVDTRGMRVVRVNDLKLSDTNSTQLRLLGAEVGMRGILRALSPVLERAVVRVAGVFGHEVPERIIAWNYMDLVDRDLSNVKLSVSHKTLDELHPADVADIIEQLDPRLRGQVFAQLDVDQAAEAMAELDDDQAAKIVGDMAEDDASKMLSEMDPDDAAELVAELDYEKAEKLLRLMGVSEQKAVRQLLGYRDGTAGRIMTPEFVAMGKRATVADVVERMRGLDEDFEPVNYIYLTDDDDKVTDVVSVRRLLLAEREERLGDLAGGEELIFATPEEDQEDVAEKIAQYNLLALPVVDEYFKILGIVTVDDALDVLEEEHEEDLHIASGTTSGSDDSEGGHDLRQLVRREAWFFCWAAGLAALLVLCDALLAPASALALGVGLPVCLLAADNMVRYVTGFYLEYDDDDEEAPSVLGFAVKSLGMGVVLAGLTWLIVTALAHGFLAGEASALGLVDASMGAAAACVVVAFLLAPAVLALFRRRDDRNLETNGFVVRFVVMAAVTVLFVALAWVLVHATLGL